MPVPWPLHRVVDRLPTIRRGTLWPAQNRQAPETQSPTLCHWSMKGLSTLTQGLHAGGFWRNKGVLWSANLLVYWLAFTSIIILAVTRVALYQDLKPRHRLRKLQVRVYRTRRRARWDLSKGALGCRTNPPSGLRFNDA